MKIGIVSMFYNSTNYGGILQAYALTKVLSVKGIKAEQILYSHESAYTLIHRMKITANKALNVMKNIRYLDVKVKILKRIAYVRQASKILVPHSKKVYSEKNIFSCLENGYDVFVTGSDQVWGRYWPAYFLEFVPDKYKKIAYAVSIGKSKIEQNQLKQIVRSTKNFYSISVRESNIKEQLSQYIDKDINLVLDPTLLLDQNEWDTICSDKLINDRYIFCYFLGDDIKIRNIATEYAQKKNSKVVTIPHMLSLIYNSDLRFGDLQLYEISPSDFISLIKYSLAVFTDSFHACVFSQIYKKQYYVFSRKGKKEMSNRLETFTQIFHSDHHYFSDEKLYNRCFQVEDIDYGVAYPEFENLKGNSLEFLFESIGL